MKLTLKPVLAMITQPVKPEKRSSGGSIADKIAALAFNLEQYNNGLEIVVPRHQYKVTRITNNGHTATNNRSK